MQFRERSRVIQLIRTVYDPAIKRGRSEVVGRLPIDAAEMTDEVRAACTEAEAEEIAAFLARRAETSTRDAMRDAAHELPVRMRQAESYFRDGEGDGELAAEIFTAWDDLKKSMVRCGFRKSRRDHER